MHRSKQHRYSIPPIPIRQRCASAAPLARSSESATPCCHSASAPMPATLSRHAPCTTSTMGARPPLRDAKQAEGEYPAYYLFDEDGHHLDLARGEIHKLPCDALRRRRRAIAE